MENPPKTVTICEDHQIVTDGLRSLIDSFLGFEVLDTVSNHTALWDSFEKHPPDILLLDLNLPGKSGIEITQEIFEKGYSFKILVLTMYNKKSIVQKVFSIGANGFLLKNCSSKDLLNALKHLSVSKDFYFGEGVHRYDKHKEKEQDSFSRRIQLTSREKEIVRYLCDGKKVPHIAEAMFISPLTVETHKKNIYKKLGVHTTAKLVSFAHENQLL